MERVNLLREVVLEVKSRYPFTIDAMVVLPDHLHALWTMPPDDADYAKRWMLIKSRFSRALGQSEKVSASRGKKGERGIWQRRYWEHLIRSKRDYRRHVDYIHYNPGGGGH